MTGLLNLALDLARIHQPERRPDYTVDLQGQSYGLSDEIDLDDLRLDWIGLIPVCVCGEPLSPHGEEDTRRAPVHSDHDAPADMAVICDYCEASYPVGYGR